MNNIEKAIQVVKEAQLAVIHSQERDNAEDFQNAELKLHEAQTVITELQEEIGEELNNHSDLFHAKELLRHLLEAQNSIR